MWEWQNKKSGNGTTRNAGMEPQKKKKWGMAPQEMQEWQHRKCRNGTTKIGNGTIKKSGNGTTKNGNGATRSRLEQGWILSRGFLLPSLGFSSLSWDFPPFLGLFLPFPALFSRFPHTPTLCRRAVLSRCVSLPKYSAFLAESPVYSVFLQAPLTSPLLLLLLFPQDPRRALPGGCFGWEFSVENKEKWRPEGELAPAELH